MVIERKHVPVFSMLSDPRIPFIRRCVKYKELDIEKYVSFEKATNQ